MALVSFNVGPSEVSDAVKRPLPEEAPMPGAVRKANGGAPIEEAPAEAGAAEAAAAPETDAEATAAPESGAETGAETDAENKD